VPRTIRQLLEAHEAGEPLTDDERDRLEAYERNIVPAVDQILGHPPPEFWNADEVTGTEADDFVDEGRRVLPSMDFEERGNYILLCWSVILMQADIIAKATGRRRRGHRGAVDKGASSGRRRREARAALLVQFDEAKAAHPDATAEDVARVLLQDTEWWLRATARERRRKAESLLRRVQLERKRQLVARHRPRH
jgi:hypothetical protein